MRLHATTTNFQFLVVVAVVVVATLLEAVSARECHNPPGDLCRSAFSKRSLPRRHLALLPKRQNDAADDLGCEDCGNGEVCWNVGSDSDPSIGCASLRVTTITTTVTVAQTQAAARTTTAHWTTVTAWTTVSPTATAAAEPSTVRPAAIVKRQQDAVEWENTQTVTVTSTAPPGRGGSAVEVTAVTTVWQTTTAAGVPLASQDAAAVGNPPKPPVGAIIGGIVATVIGIGILAAVFLVVRRRRRLRSRDGAYIEKNVEPPQPMGRRREVWDGGYIGGGGHIVGGKQTWTPSPSSGSTEAEGLRTRPRIRVSIPETAVAVPLPPPTSPRLQIVSPTSTHHPDSTFDSVFLPLSAHHRNEPLSATNESRSTPRPGNTTTSSGSPHSSLTLTDTPATATGPPQLPLDLLQSEMYGGFDFSLSGVRTSTVSIDPPPPAPAAPEAPAAPAPAPAPTPAPPSVQAPAPALVSTHGIPRKPVPARPAK